MGPGPPSAHLLPCSGRSLPPWASQSRPDDTAGCPWPPPAHSPPPAAWLCQELTGAASKHRWAPAQGSAPAIRARPWLCRGAKVGAGEGPAGRRHQPPPAGCRGRWGNKQGGAILFSTEGPRCPGVFHPCLVSSSASWSPRSMGSLPAPLSSLPCFLLHPFLGLSQQGFQGGGWGWGGN